MANVDFQGEGGMVPCQDKGEPRITWYYKDADLASAVFIGDIVTAEGDGGIGLLANGASSVIILGVSASYSAASTAAWIAVYDDPATRFLIYGDASGTGLTSIASVFGNADIVKTHTGNATTGRGATELQESSVATTNTLPLRIIGLHSTPDNAWGANARVKVMFNPAKHFYTQSTGV